MLQVIRGFREGIDLTSPASPYPACKFSNDCQGSWLNPCKKRPLARTDCQQILHSPSVSSGEPGWRDAEKREKFPDFDRQDRAGVSVQDHHPAAYSREAAYGRLLVSPDSREQDMATQGTSLPLFSASRDSARSRLRSSPNLLTIWSVRSRVFVNSSPTARDRHD
jgi:hypothetical protein